MEKERISNLEFFEMTRNRKKMATEKIVKWDFTKKYIFIFLILFTIYQILSYIFVDSKSISELNFRFNLTITTLDKYIQINNDIIKNILILAISMIVCNFLNAFISSISIFNKYNIKKDEINKIIKFIIILQVIVLGILCFDFFIKYSNENNGTNWMINGLLENYNNKDVENSKSVEDISYINECKSNLNNMQLNYFVILIVLNISSTTINILIQKKVCKSLEVC